MASDKDNLNLVNYLNEISDLRFNSLPIESAWNGPMNTVLVTSSVLIRKRGGERILFGKLKLRPDLSRCELPIIKRNELDRVGRW